MVAVIRCLYKLRRIRRIYGRVRVRASRGVTANTITVTHTLNEYKTVLSQNASTDLRAGLGSGAHVVRRSLERGGCESVEFDGVEYADGCDSFDVVWVDVGGEFFRFTFGFLGGRV